MQRIYETDPWLMPYKDAIDARHEHIWQTLRHIAGDGRLKDAVNNHMSTACTSVKTAAGCSASMLPMPARYT